MKYLVVYRRDVSFPSASQRCGTLRFPQTAFSLNHPLRSERVADERSEVPLRREEEKKNKKRLDPRLLHTGGTRVSQHGRFVTSSLTTGTDSYPSLPVLFLCYSSHHYYSCYCCCVHHWRCLSFSDVRHHRICSVPSLSLDVVSDLIRFCFSLPTCRYLLTLPT